MADNLTDRQMIEKVLLFYANKKNYEPQMGVIEIWNDKGLRAGMALSALRERKPEPLWLTEELAALQGYSIIELENGCIWKLTSRSGLNFKYIGNDFHFVVFREYAELNPFATKYIALLALAKHFERINKKNKIINTEEKMLDFREYDDEFRDFSLLITNQLLLGIFMTELPILSYKILVGTDENHKHNQPLILEYKWLGGINTDQGDTRRTFFLYTHIKDEGEDFKLIFFLQHSKMGLFEETEEPIAIKEFLFKPTDRSGEAIVNETLIWIRKIMVEIMSGSN